MWRLLVLLPLLTSFTPVEVPNGIKLPYEVEGETKVFHLIAEPVQWEIGPNLILNCWGYNGIVPGPLIEAEEGDHVRILVTNKLPEPTTVHWHGLILPSGMDGVTGLNQPPIPSGETFQYEFTLKQSGTYMYHSHYDEMVQIGMGMHGFFIIHPKEPIVEVDRDYAIMLSMFSVAPGTANPDPISNDFNYFTYNGTVWPTTESLIAREGEKIRIRFGNLSMDSHPIHIHGHEFTVVAKGARRLNPSAQYDVVTVDVPTGNTRDIEMIAAYPGDWAMHCHKSHHVMNGMIHELTNLIDVKIPEATIKKLQELIPGFMPMGIHGMGQMYDHHHHPLPPNTVPFGSPGPFGIIEMSGMFSVIKIRRQGESFEGWYKNPEGTVASPVSRSEE